MKPTGKQNDRPKRPHKPRGADFKMQRDPDKSSSFVIQAAAAATLGAAREVGAALIRLFTN